LFLRAVYCVAGCGVFAQVGTTPSTLLLPEQAASSAAKMNAATMRIMMRVPELDTRPMRTN
jgi:hypothetical protein